MSRPLPAARSKINKARNRAAERKRQKLVWTWTGKPLREVESKRTIIISGLPAIKEETQVRAGHEKLEKLAKSDARPINSLLVLTDELKSKIKGENGSSSGIMD